MKYTSLAVAALSLTAAHAVTLVSPTLNNGGFQTNGGSNTNYTTGTNWFNYGAGSETTNVYLNNNGLVSGASSPSQNTGWTISDGNVFNLTFDIVESGATAGNPINWTLYYYGNEGNVGFDETSDTSAVALFSGSGFTSGTTIESGDLTFDAGTEPDAVGQTLYLRFNRNTAGGFPTIDDVNLTAVPEPSSAALVGLGGVALLARRKRG